MAGAAACPECRGRFEQINMKGVTVDRCLECGGHWFDAGELTLSVEILRPITGFDTGTPTQTSCPRCTTDSKLVVIQFPGTELKIGACPRCKGTYLPHGRLEELHVALEPIVGKSGKSPTGERTAEILAEIEKRAEGPKCPHCKVALGEHVTKKGTPVERCPKCLSIWHDDGGKLTAELEVARKISLKEGTKTEFLCPRCPGKMLVSVKYPKTEVLIEVCPDCRGSLVGEKAYEDLRMAVRSVSESGRWTRGPSSSDSTTTP
jgi:Zn-finger nucleic acid-binding protein